MTARLPLAVHAVAWIDGGARGNPGPAGYGVHIESGNGSLITELHEAIGVATNNVAEYSGLVAALDYLASNGYRNVLIRSDSQLLVKQMSGAYNVRAPSLRRLYVKASATAARFEQVQYQHVPREQNTRADQLANLAIDGATAARPQPSGMTGQPAGTPSPQVARTKAAPPVGPGAGGIIGIGIDIEEIARVDELLQRYGDRFVARIFTDGEAAYCRRRQAPGAHFAARFSAKEAAMKALGTGRSQGVLWRNIEVVRHGGPPTLALHGGAERRFDALGGGGSLVTLTHSRHYSVAQVILLGPS